jgi:hypothetical protein
VERAWLVFISVAAPVLRFALAESDRNARALCLQRGLHAKGEERGRKVKLPAGVL